MTHPSTPESSTTGLTCIEMPPETAGRYVLQSLIGRGAGGEVWQAEDPGIGRQVAVKILRVPAELSDEERREWETRFLQEARAAGRLAHPGIVSIHDVGKTRDGRPFIVMELIEGRSLDSIIRGTPRPAPSDALIWGAEVAEALDAAHARGIVHRDVKPANILIDGEGHARIVDFGIARLSESDLTRTGLFLGSPAYSSPEQLQGRAVDGRSDLFSLGAMLHAVLTGARPFKGEELPAIAYAICHAEPAPPSREDPNLPAGCDAVILRALQKAPERRYQTGREMASDLRGLAGAAGAGAAPARDPAAEFRRRLQTVAAGARRLARRGRAAWDDGWSRGPRVRAAMVAGLVLLLAALTWGSVLVVYKAVHKESAGERMRKRFKALVSSVEVPHAERGEGASTSGSSPSGAA